MVQNNTLSYLSIGYGLVTVFPKGYKNKAQKAAADIFEAGVGAFLLDETPSGHLALVQWISTLSSP